MRSSKIQRYWVQRKPGDVAGALAVVVLLIAAIFMWLNFPLFPPRANFGFGPDWQCTYPGRGEPICVKSEAVGPTAAVTSPTAN